MVEKITVEEIHRRFKAQGVSGREHIAFKCPICSTVQSLALLIREGAKPEEAEKLIGFSCVGRVNNAGEWPHSDVKKQQARTKPGCNWTLGGLFQIHKLAVVGSDGKEQPAFEVATPEEAQALEREMQAVQQAAE
jgi:hypothetical protein